MKQLTKLFFTVVALAAIPFAQGVNITGTIINSSGAAVKGAKVLLVQQNIIATTDDQGKYKLENITVIDNAAFVHAQSNVSVSLNGQNLRLNTGNTSQMVTVSLFSMSGQKIKDLVNTNVQGTYVTNPFSGNVSRGMYILKIQIGQNRFAFAANSVSNSIFLSDNAGATNSLRQASVVSDTIVVIARGFDRAEKIITTFTGTQDFKLTAVKYTNIAYNTPAISGCALDVHVPSSGSNWPVYVHFHGGGMTGGDKDEGWTSYYNNWGPKFLAQGILVVGVNYRLVGKGGHWPSYIQDCAAASAWVRKNIECYGGNPESIILGGFSAGGYLAHMLSLDTTYLNEAGVNQKQFAGFISLSGQTKSHSSIQSDLGSAFDMNVHMPIGHARKTTVPWMIIVGQNEGNTVTDNKALFDACIQAGATDLTMEVVPGGYHTTNDMGDGTSYKRDKYFAFINKYKAN